jgi:hypothetical protein
MMGWRRHAAVYMSAISRFADITRRSPQKKIASKFDEQSHYVIENKGSTLRTKPNEASFPFTIQGGDLACRVTISIE